MTLNKPKRSKVSLQTREADRRCAPRGNTKDVLSLGPEQREFADGGKLCGRCSRRLCESRRQKGESIR